MAVLSVTQDELVDAANQIQQVYTVTFTVADRPGSFIVTVPKSGDPVAAAAAAIGVTRDEVLGIYGIST